MSDSLQAEIRTYRATDKAACMLIFDSNCPKYFGENERAQLGSFLGDKDHDDYFVMEIEGSQGTLVVGAGGYYLLPETHVVGFSWGMILNDYHRRGLGKQLAMYRLALLAKKFPNQEIRLQTSQHTRDFYAKHGFAETEYEKDGFAEGIDRITMIRLGAQVQ